MATSSSSYAQMLWYKADHDGHGDLKEVLKELQEHDESDLQRRIVEVAAEILGVDLG